jgi:CBS-domain-containing membrane protein
MRVSEEGAAYYAAAQQTDHSREEIAAMIQQARENVDMDRDEIRELIEQTT